MNELMNEYHAALDCTLCRVIFVSRSGFDLHVDWLTPIEEQKTADRGRLYLMHSLLSCFMTEKLTFWSESWDACDHWPTELWQIQWRV